VPVCSNRFEGTVVRAIAMRLKYERRLVLAATPEWIGWFCERCCWHITVRTAPTPQQGTANAQEQFDAHDCEEYALQNWKQSEAPVEGR
jgi:hypothetical protein